jgi:uncharacterized protein YndB with AHSA1/START domain
MSTVADQKTILYMNRLIAASRGVPRAGIPSVDHAGRNSIELGGSTEIRLTHENLPSDEAREGHRHGWSGSFDKLAKHLAH